MQFIVTKEVGSQSLQEVKFVCYILRSEDLRKLFKWPAYVVSGGAQTRFSIANTFPKIKKSFSWKTSSVSKEAAYVCRHFIQLSQITTI